MPLRVASTDGLGLTEHQPADGFRLKLLLLGSFAVRREVLMVQEVPLLMGEQQWETEGLAFRADRQELEGCLASKQTKDLRRQEDVARPSGEKRASEPSDVERIEVEWFELTPPSRWDLDCFHKRNIVCVGGREPCASEAAMVEAAVARVVGE